MENLFEKLATLLISSGFRYFIFAGIPFLIFYIVFSNYYSKNKIQGKSPKKQTFLNEIKNSIMTIGVIAVIASLILFTPFRQYTLIYDDIHQYSFWWIPLSVILSLIFHDTYFYWLHRFIHSKKIYPYIHLTHHKSTNPSPWTSYSFDLFEAILENMILLIMVFILPLHSLSILIFGLLTFIINVYGHLGYEIMPKWFRHSFLFQIINTSVYHNLHHKKFKGNYALYFRWWDRIMGTENKEYVKLYDEIQDRRFGDLEEKKTSFGNKGLLTLMIVAALMSFNLESDEDAAKEIIGEWISEGENGKAIVKIYKAKNGKYYGKYIEALDPEQHKIVEEEMKAKGKTILYILKEFEYAGESKWKNGKFFAPKRRAEVDGEMELLKNGKLKVTGYYMGFSKTYYWEKKK